MAPANGSCFCMKTHIALINKVFHRFFYTVYLLEDGNMKAATGGALLRTFVVFFDHIQEIDAVNHTTQM